jgi:hypothetical protein
MSKYNLYLPFIIVIGLFFTSCTPHDTDTPNPQLKSYEIAFTQSSIVIDGKLNEGA